ncbi:protein ADM2 [Melopsittacus undulatus]|uniref:protein ADM2 n=1 Tax=Melopsittacus undulatus TaxID=13146 RepID=UPI00146BF28E|nr:protein ADM2 [Melopsittacus undulatus]
MRAPVPVALGCISLVLCVLELPAGLPRPHGRAHRRRDPPDHIPSLLPPFMDPALPHAAGTARHRLPAPWLPQAHVPQHRLPAPWLPQAHVPQHRYRHTRGRRHTQLLRVGCVLGTCQVQNLSHRLWQLRGQLGRQDSSPMNPHSPHSYG